MKTKIFWGVFLVLAGVYLIVGQLGYLPEMGIVTILLTGLCIAVFVHGILHAGFGEILFSLAVAACLYDKLLGITAITPWTVLLAALLGTIGLNLIFGKMKKKYQRNHYKNSFSKFHHIDRMAMENDDADLGNDDGENVEISSSFGSVVRYVTSEDFHSADINARCSGVTVYFDNAKVPAGNAVVNIESSFSGIELYVPGAWQVINHMNVTLGGVEEKNKKFGEKTVVLTLDGKLTLGGVTVYYL